MDSRQLINGALLAALCIVCGCKTPAAGDDLLQKLGVDHLQEDQAWNLQQYCDPQRYTYHQTCWRPLDYEPCDWASNAECGEQQQAAAPGEILEGPPAGQTILPEAAPIVPIPRPNSGAPQPSLEIPPPPEAAPLNAPRSQEGGVPPAPQAPPAPPAPPSEPDTTYWLSPPVLSDDAPVQFSSRKPLHLQEHDSRPPFRHGA